jgi:hypothetical protein
VNVSDIVKREDSREYVDIKEKKEERRVKREERSERSVCIEHSITHDETNLDAGLVDPAVPGNAIEEKGDHQRRAE